MGYALRDKDHAAFCDCVRLISYPKLYLAAQVGCILRIGAKKCYYFTEIMSVPFVYDHDLFGLRPEPGAVYIGRSLEYAAVKAIDPCAQRIRRFVKVRNDIFAVLCFRHVLHLS